jgi:hypothetical protein
MNTNNQPDWDAKEKGMMHMNYFRTLCEFYKGGQLLDDDINLKAKKMVDNVWATYHGEEKQILKPMQPQVEQTNKESKQKPTICPKCKKFSLYHNKGTSRAGNPYENLKCKCGYIEWLTDNYYTAKAKAQAQDQIDDEANHIPVIEENNY